jgi:2-haloacid dehalogenase
MEQWFTRTLRDGIALAATRDYAPFGEVAAQAPRIVSGCQADEAGIAHVLAGLSELPAHPAVLPAARILAGAGIRLPCLTNGSAALTRAFVQRAGLGGYVERVISVEEAGTWKPSAAVYRHTARVLGVAPERLALVAEHAWDCHGGPRRADHRLGEPPGTRVLLHLRRARHHRPRPHRGRARLAGPARPPGLSRR